MKKVIALFISLIVSCGSLCFPLYAQGITPVDTSKKASLTLNYQQDDQTFSNLEINIYRVAKALETGTFELVEPFSFYPINIYDISVQDEWENTAETITSYVVANNLIPYKSDVTNENGTVSFTDLETGLYFVNEVAAENKSGTYIFNQFLVYLPTPQADGTYNYDVEAKPKCSNFAPKTEYRVTKLWQDKGKQNERPKKIEVNIYKNGKLQETQILSKDNNWTYAWYVSENDYSKWTVSENSTPKNYMVNISQKGGVFSIVNIHKGETTDSDSPQTGETTNVLYWALITCFVGVVLIIIGVYSRRKAQ